MVEQAGWGTTNGNQLKYCCGMSLNHTSWSVSMGKCQGCPTVKEELQMNFPTYPGKVKAVQSWIQQTQNLLSLETGTICAHQHIQWQRWKKSHKVFQPPYPKTASTSATAASINTEYGKKNFIQLSLRLKKSYSYHYSKQAENMHWHLDIRAVFIPTGILLAYATRNKSLHWQRRPDWVEERELPKEASLINK